MPALDPASLALLPESNGEDKRQKMMLIPHGFIVDLVQ